MCSTTQPHYFHDHPTVRNLHPQTQKDSKNQRKASVFLETQFKLVHGPTILLKSANSLPYPGTMQVDGAHTVRDRPQTETIGRNQQETAPFIMSLLQDAVLSQTKQLKMHSNFRENYFTVYSGKSKLGQKHPPDHIPQPSPGQQEEVPCRLFGANYK